MPYTVKKYSIVLQHSEEDCGAACIATIAKHYGLILSISRIREMVGTGRFGTSLLGLKRGAESLGFQALPVKATPELIEKLHEISLPAVIHWKGNHWVVLYQKKGKKYVIADPGVGIRYISHEELITAWANGVVLLLFPGENQFYPQESDKIRGFGRFLGRVLPYRWILTEAIIINLTVGLLSLTSPFLTQILTDDVLVRGDTQLLTSVAIGIIAMNLFNSVIGLVQSHLLGYFGQRLEYGLILEYGQQLLRLPLTYFESRRSGEVVSRLSDVRAINALVHQIIVGLPSKFFIALVSLGFMLFYSWQLTIASSAAFVIVTLVNLTFLPALRQKTRASIVQATENQGFLVETFRGIQVLKTTPATPQAWDEYQRNFSRIANLGWSTMKLELYSSTITGILSNLTNIALLWMGSYLVIDRTLTIGQLLAFNSMSGNFLGFLGAVIGLIDQFITAQIVIQRLTEVLDATPEEQNSEKKPWTEIPGDAEIICTNLNFHHAGRSDLLKDFSLNFPGGKVIALIGKSGCGKSTLAKLIASLYTPQSGSIRLGIYNQKDISLECLRQQIVLVTQEVSFWSRSIIENFYFSYPNIKFDQIVKACQIACADEFIREFPDSYQTMLGEFGVNMSGGQRQRLALARAIVTDPPILILDESTSALDPVLEAQVLDKLLFYRQGKTTIIISHRPRVILRADFIVLLEKGVLKMQGSPKDLLNIPGDHLDFLTP
ncbi:MAG: peptidase domain-containing ABC transporter [Stigonema ocellatum SAG 48.90 = DSM 106950]|nr:peptidase domain-containing ABC transporter [Stigonema ocellatum SAG 48.90 = DSM 106950]